MEEEKMRKEEDPRNGAYLEAREAVVGRGGEERKHRKSQKKLRNVAGQLWTGVQDRPRWPGVQGRSAFLGLPMIKRGTLKATRR
jgi:hypothetical protein